METPVQNCNYHLPQIGYGTYPQKETLVDNVHNAIDVGYRLIDTSDNYQNEKFIGTGLRKKPGEEVTVISKFSQPYKTDKLEDCFDESKEKLNRQLNVYLLHWPYPFLWKVQWRKMEQLYLDGKVEVIGVCNFDVKHLKKLLKFCKVRPVIDQFERHPVFQQNDIYKFCKSNDIQVMCYSPLARFDPVLMDNDVLKNLADKYHKTVGQIILRWDIDTGCVPIPAASSEEHMKENFDIFDFALTEEEIDQINALEDGHRIRFDPKTRFSFKQKTHFLIKRIKMFFGIQ